MLISSGLYSCCCCEFYEVFCCCCCRVVSTLIRTNSNTFCVLSSDCYFIMLRFLAYSGSSQHWCECFFFVGFFHRSASFIFPPCFFVVVWHENCQNHKFFASIKYFSIGNEDHVYRQTESM